MPAYEYADPDDLLAVAASAGEPPLIVALDGITDPRNLGAIVRSAAAFGAHGVVVPERRAAGMTASAWKTSAGAAARVPVARVTNLTRALGKYARRRAARSSGWPPTRTLASTTCPFVDGPLVLVVGAEGDGLSRLVREHCDAVVVDPDGVDHRVAQRRCRGRDRVVQHRGAATARLTPVRSRLRRRGAIGSAPDL